jgi:carboxypeptidase Taq
MSQTMFQVTSTIDCLPPKSAYGRLLARLRLINTVRSARSVLSWEMKTYMPKGGASSRSDQMAYLAGQAHKLFTAPATGRLIEKALAQIADFDPASAEAHIVRLAAQDYKRDRRLPASFVDKFSRVTSLAETAWEEAREKNSFALFLPHLEQVIALVREKAGLLGYESDVYDALIDEFEPGMSTTELRRIFAELKARLVPLIRAVQKNATAIDDTCLQQSFAVEAQEAFCREFVLALGLNPLNARLDKSTHPFSSGIASPFDVRITARYSAKHVMGSIASVTHEFGHAFYEMGLPAEYAGTPLAQAISTGVHESQSRLWQNCVGLGRAFWAHWYQRLQQHFPDQLGLVSCETFYRAINKVAPSLVRTEADELTYNLHVIIRFELELALVEGKLKVADLPAAWNDKYEELLGIRPSTDSAGVLQDTHWAVGAFGYFPTYTLGNLISIQLWEQALLAHPDLELHIANADYEPLSHWLRTNVHGQGRRFDTRGLIRNVCGSEIQVDPFASYLERKYGELYGIKG